MSLWSTDYWSALPIIYPSPRHRGLRSLFPGGDSFAAAASGTLRVCAYRYSHQFNPSHMSCCQREAAFSLMFIFLPRTFSLRLVPRVLFVTALSLASLATLEVQVTLFCVPKPGYRIWIPPPSPILTTSSDGVPSLRSFLLYYSFSEFGVFCSFLLLGYETW